MLTIVNGDLLNAIEDYICHQCNCVTNKGKGLSEAIFTKWPNADIYKNRKGKGTCGKIIVIDKIINMVAQFYPGKPKYKSDSTENRIQWFSECLEQIAEIPNITSVAFPYNIGCGLAGGDWNVYVDMLQHFADKNAHINVVIYKL